MEEITMQRILAAVAMLCLAATSSQAAAKIHHAGNKPSPHHVVRDNSHTVTYDKDSPNPAVGWHWENGMRVRHHDCGAPRGRPAVPAFRGHGFAGTIAA